MHAQVVQGRYFCLRLFMFGLWRCLYFINIRSASRSSAGSPYVQAHSDRRAEKTAEAAMYDAFGPNHGGAFRPFDCGRTA